MNAIVSPISRGQGHELVNMLEAAGLHGELAQTVIDAKNNELAKKVVRLIENRGRELSTNQKRTRKIMGKNFFGVEDAIRHFGVSPTKSQLDALSEIPFSESTLAAVKDTHVLVAVFPLSILDISERFTADGLIYDRDWHDIPTFVKNEAEFGWHLIRKTPAEKSLNKAWNKQQALLGGIDKIPKAQVMVYTIIGHYKVTGERLFETVSVRCSTIESEDIAIFVGDFDAEGLTVSYGPPSDRFPDLGLASARKA